MKNVVSFALAAIVLLFIIMVAGLVQAADLRIPKLRKPSTVSVIGPLAQPGPVVVGKHVIRKNEDVEATGRHVGMP